MLSLSLDCAFGSQISTAVLLMLFCKPSQGSVLIFDEAHNLLDAVNGAHSATITGLPLLVNKMLGKQCAEGCSSAITHGSFDCCAFWCRNEPPSRGPLRHWLLLSYGCFSHRWQLICLYAFDGVVWNAANRLSRSPVCLLHWRNCRVYSQRIHD